MVVTEGSKNTGRQPAGESDAQMDEFTAGGFVFLDRDAPVVELTHRLSDAIRVNLPEDSELIGAIAAAETDSSMGEVFLALRVPSAEPLGSGAEAICFELQPTAELSKNLGFVEVLSREFHERDALRAKLLAEIPVDTSGYPSDSASVAEQCEFLLDNLPNSFVVKVVAPEGGSWDSEWGYREFDTPIYFSHELEDGNHRIVLQERLEVIDSPAALKAILTEGYEVIDAIGSIAADENGGATGQAGVNRFGERRLLDYGAVGPLGADPDKALMSSFHTSDEEAEYAETQRSDSFDLSGVDIDIEERRQRALEGEGEFWQQDSHREILQELIDASGGSTRAPEKEDVEQIVLLRALQMSGDNFQENLSGAKRLVEAVLELARSQSLFAVFRAELP